MQTDKLLYIYAEPLIGCNGTEVGELEVLYNLACSFTIIKTKKEGSNEL